MKAAELRQLSEPELQNRLDEAKSELMNLRFQNASGQLADSNRLSALRRDVARILTVLSERDMEAANE